MFVLLAVSNRVKKKKKGFSHLSQESREFSPMTAAVGMGRECIQVVITGCGIIKNLSGLCSRFLAQNFKNLCNFLSDGSVLAMLMRCVMGGQ